MKKKTVPIVSDSENTAEYSRTKRNTPGNRRESRFHIINELRSGRKSDEVFERFMRISRIPNKTLAEKVLEITPKTLNSYRNSSKDMPVKLTEHMIKLEELYEKGIELFGDPGRFNNWLKSESYGLGNIEPIIIINSITGIDLVYEELIRIEFGATA
jgi:putative toxin-antitoxin system antitoxin component (TIGR02293 family)